MPRWNEGTDELSFMMGESSKGFTNNILIIRCFALQWREWKVKVDFDQFSNERRKDRKRGRKFLPPSFLPVGPAEGAH